MVLFVKYPLLTDLPSGERFPARTGHPGFAYGLYFTGTKNELQYTRQEFGLSFCLYATIGFNAAVGLLNAMVYLYRKD